jgi:hypothetical protein
MVYCSALNGYVVQEVYLPSNLNLQGTCNVIESLGRNMHREIFGPGKTFRDTPNCREIVLQYLCLFWGSDNNMYTNCCRYSEVVTSLDPVNNIVAARPPCRSFCVQVILCFVLLLSSLFE